MGTKNQDGCPSHFGRYVVKRKIGQGGMGRVYLAEDPGIGRQVAIKIVHVSEDASPEFRNQIHRRFEVEVRAAGNLTHPNIATIYDVGEQDERAYVAMEYVPGESLKSVLMSERRLSFKEISDLTSQLCRALDYAHDRGVVHRDIKPGNILLTADGIPKIVDFGLAKTLSAGSEASTRLTQVGTIIGTPAYMSPEQVTGHDVTAVSDQFSLAVIVYEMLTGHLPFQGEGATTVMYKIVHEDPPALRSFNKRLPGKIDEAVLRALAKDPAGRYPSCDEFARAVRVVLSSAPLETEMSEQESARIDATIMLKSPALQPHRAVALDVPTDSPSDPGATVVMPAAGRASSAAETVVAARPVAAKPQVSTAAPARSRVRVFAMAAVLMVAASILAIVVLSPGGASDPVSSEPEASAGEQSIEGKRPDSQGPPDSAAAAGSSPTTSSTPAAVDPTPLEASAVAESPYVRDMQVTSYPAGAEIWLDGEDLRLRTPALVTFEGEIGDRLRLELRRGSNRIANTQIVLGPDMASNWSPGGSGAMRAERRRDTRSAAPGELATFSITSRPTGARVSLDGEQLDGVTPLRAELDLAKRHSLRLDLPGHKTESWAFALPDLSDDQRQSRTLHFPLTAAAPPATLRVIAPDYTVRLTIDGRRYDPASRHEIELPSGTREIEISAPEVFLHQSLQVELPAGGTREIPLPIAWPVQIAATPGNCRVSIDGRFVDVTPFQARIVTGEHEFEFFWPGLGRTIRRTERIGKVNQRIFAALE